MRIEQGRETRKGYVKMTCHDGDTQPNQGEPLREPLDMTRSSEEEWSVPSEILTYVYRGLYMYRKTWEESGKHPVLLSILTQCFSCRIPIYLFQLSCFLDSALSTMRNS